MRLRSAQRRYVHRRRRVQSFEKEVSTERLAAMRACAGPCTRLDPLGASTEAMAQEAQLGDLCPRFLRGPRTGFKNAKGDTSQSCAPLRASGLSNVLARPARPRTSRQDRTQPYPQGIAEQERSTLDSPPSRGVHLRAPEGGRRPTGGAHQLQCLVGQLTPRPDWVSG